MHFMTFDDRDPLWDRWLAAQPTGHVLQLRRWARLKEQFGWRSRLVTLPDAQGGIAAGASILLRRMAGLTLAYVPRGPVVDWRNAAAVADLLAQMQATSRQAGAAVLKLEPNLPDTPANRQLLTGYGLRPSPQTIQPPSTIIVDISVAPDAILAQMKSKWRYNVRLAERKAVRVRAMSRADLPAFHALMAETGVRDHFAVHDNAYYDAAFDLLTPEHAVYLLAEYDAAPLAAIVVALAGDTALYLWGASSERERNRMPNHALQWAGMQWAKARGATRYDLWGIPDPVGQVAQGMRSGDGSGVPSADLPLDVEAFPNTGLWGVYRFKQGFGGDVVRFIGAWDLPVDPVGYRVYSLGLGVYARLKAGRAEHTVAPPTAELTPVAEAGAWRDLLAGLPAPHILQSWEWGAIKGQTEWRAERYALRAPAGSAAVQLLWRQIGPYAPARVAYIPKGPVVDWANPDLVDATLAAVEMQARRLGCIFVKIDPDVREDTTAGRLVLHALERRGWRYSAEQIQFKNTAVSDLRVGEDALLAGMKSKWRYNVRLAEKRGITVRLGAAADLPAFYDLYAETGARDGFLIRPFAYYRTTWATLLDAQATAANPAGGALLLAEHPDEPAPVAGLFLFRYGDRAWYFYGASSERRRRDMPNYLLQWEALRWSLAQGCTVYDWWGAPTQLDDPHDGMQGVWQFKQGFGAAFQPHIGAWDFVVSPLGYRLYSEAMPRVLAWLRQRG
jgi:peptidoglycan pentaglycine glycine transferase (the first glycine)